MARSGKVLDQSWDRVADGRKFGLDRPGVK